jgi:7,8-dihydropterin-6-yl-methyl-4-(beta-D-ribofuranosyl)aminobenzene 5'-phosphate synthase
LRIHALRILTFLLVYVAAVPCRAQDKVTILYDAFGESKELTKDWGFSALVEHNGKRILFDTGNDAAIFEHNVKALGVELTKLDFVVISHRHADHTTGLRYVLKVNPNVTVYVPADGGNGFGGLPFPKTFCGQMRACRRRCGISGERIRNISHGASCMTRGILCWWID